jgi:uncharacterized membrane protein (DUF4010 family)
MRSTADPAQSVAVTGFYTARVDRTLELVLTFAVSGAIGLLVGAERERKATAKAGVRTFALIAVLGTACALLARLLASPWLLVAGFVLVGLTLAAAYVADPRSVSEDSGTTTVAAALLVYVLGALNFHGERTLAVALGVGMTALLHFKTELEGVATRLTPTDIRSMLQFGAVSAVVLPLLPDRSFGPYQVLNPFHIWLMVVLISGVSLAGYVAWRLTLERKGLLLAGLLGGLVSSTATTLAYARHARDAVQTPSAALVVIVLANAVMLVRVALLVFVIEPTVLIRLAPALFPAALLTAPGLWWHWARTSGEKTETPARLQNPTQFGTALVFALLYALILIVAAWLSDVVGRSGLFALSFVSGLTEVDAITLSLARLAEQGNIAVDAAATAIALAVSANLLFKAALSVAVGGRTLGRSALIAFALPLAGLWAGLLLLRALA